jgi:hypothetical protein
MLARSVFRRIGDGFEAGFEKLARAYEGVLGWALEHRRAVIIALLSFSIASLFCIRSSAAISFLQWMPGNSSHFNIWPTILSDYCVYRMNHRELH